MLRLKWLHHLDGINNVGTAGKVIAIDGFGASAPGDLVVENMDLLKENILNQVMSL